MTSKTKKLGKRILSIALCVVMLATAFFVFDPMSAFALGFDVWYGTASATEFTTPDGGNNYYINSAAALAYFASTVTNGTTYKGKTVHLNCDVDLNGNNGLVWAGIGRDANDAYSFRGAFDGHSHTIKNMYCTSAGNYLGLFRRIGSETGVIISNLKISNAIVGVNAVNTTNYYHGVLVGCLNGSNNQSSFIIRNVEVSDSIVFGKHSVGGFVGIIDTNAIPIFTGCKFSGCIQAFGESDYSHGRAGGFVGSFICFGKKITFADCINNGTVIGAGGVGGFVGYIGDGARDPHAEFISCINNGEIASLKNDVGGFVGYHYSDGTLKFSQCTNNGYVHNDGTSGNPTAGGFVGQSCGNEDQFVDCINTGVVAAANVGSSKAAGLLAYHGEDNPLTFNHCYNTGNIISNFAVGGIIGNTLGKATLTDSYNLGIMYGYPSSNSHAGGMVGVAFGGIAATRCFNGNGFTGDIGTPSNPVNVGGGITGYTSSNSTLKSCYNNASINGSAYGGGLIGVAISAATAEYCYNAGAINGINRSNIINSSVNTVTSNCYYLTGSGASGGVPVSLKQLTTEGDILNILPGFVSDKSGSNSYFHTLSCYKEDFHNIEIAGRLDYADRKSIAGYATVDVYINGTLVADDCTEFSQVYPVGTTYEIKDFKLTDSTKLYNGLVADPNGNYNGLIGTVEKTSPEIMGAKFDISNAINGIDVVTVQDSTSYYIFANIEPADDIIRVQMHTWTETGGQDDELPDWQTNNLAKAAKGSWTVDGKAYNYRYQLNTALHGGEVNDWYNTQIVAFDRDNRQHDLFQPLRYRFEFTADFDSNGGSSVDSITRYCGEALDTLPIPTRTGYTFVGWFTNAVSGREITAETPMNFGDITYYAHWTPNRYTITFDTAGGSAVNPITQDFDSVVNPPANPTKFGYTFVGWDKPIPTVMPNENITITAIWSTNTYTATFNENGGTDLSFQSITREYNEALGELPTVSREGYTFNGWYSDIYGGTKINESTTMPSQDVSYYANWSINRYTISFDTTGGTTIQPIIRNYGSTVPTIPKPRMTGYTFAGWDKEIPLTMPAEDFTLTAIWTPNNYTVSFMPNGGNVSSSSKAVTYASTYGELPTPTWKDHVFLGWYTSASGGEQITSETTVRITAAQTLYAQWHRHNHINGACECGDVIYSLKNGAVIDNGLIYGLKADMNVYSFAKYFSFTQGYSLSVVKAENGYGTGTKLKIKDEDDNVIETLYAVVFGDVNGDSVYDGMDSVVVSCMANGLLTREQTGEAVWLAADCNHDGAIDNGDVELLGQAGLILAEIQQSEDVIETLSLQSEYETLISQTIPTQEEPHKNTITLSEFFRNFFDFIKGFFIRMFDI